MASAGGWRLPGQPGSIAALVRPGPAEGGLRARAGPGCDRSAGLHALCKASGSGPPLPPLGLVMLGRMDGHRSLPSEVSVVSALGKRSYSGVAVVVKMGLKWLLQPTSPLLLRYETLD